MTLLCFPNIGEKSSQIVYYALKENVHRVIICVRLIPRT